MLLVPTHRFSAKTCSVKSKLNLANLYLNKTSTLPNNFPPSGSKPDELTSFLLYANINN